jgi:hypothetical protein
MLRVPSAFWAFAEVAPTCVTCSETTRERTWKMERIRMGHDRRSWCGTLQRIQRGLTQLGCCLLAGCSLVTGFEREGDAAGTGPDIEEHDAALPPPDDEDAAGDEGSATAPDAAEADAALTDGGPEPSDDAGSDPGPASADAATAGSVPEAGAGQVPDAGASNADPDAGARPSVGDLIDAVGGERKDRTDRICDCPGAGQECVRAGFGKSSCLERGLMLLAGGSEENVRALLECMLPAEQAYTKCVEARLRCRDVESSTVSCGIEYELATSRCNISSIQGLSLQGLCAR